MKVTEERLQIGNPSDYTCLRLPGPRSLRARGSNPRRAQRRDAELRKKRGIPAVEAITLCNALSLGRNFEIEIFARGLEHSVHHRAEWEASVMRHLENDLHHLGRSHIAAS